MYSKTQAWSISTHLKVAHAIMIPMISYFLSLLPWTKKSLDHLARSLKYIPWKKETKVGIMEQYLYPKTVKGCCFTKFRISYGGSKIQSFEKYVHRYLTLGKTISYFVEKVGIYNGKMSNTSW